MSGMPVVRATYFSSASPGDVRSLGPNNELVFNLTAPLTSTLTTTATAALDGTVVECNGESLMLSVAMISRFWIIQCSLITVTHLPRPPTSPQQS